MSNFDELREYSSNFEDINNADYQLREGFRATARQTFETLLKSVKLVKNEDNTFSFECDKIIEPILQVTAETFKSLLESYIKLYDN